MTYKDDIQLHSDKDIIALSDSHGLRFFEIKNIIRCKSDNSYTEFHVVDPEEKSGESMIVVSKGFDDFEKFLHGHGPFFRVHNQHLVNIAFISKYVKDDGNYLIMKDKNSTQIPLARARKDSFLTYLKENGISF